MQFERAQRKRAKLRLALAGPAGSGKTWGALMVAKGLGGRIAVIDTERGSASLYSDLVDFDTMELAPPFSPERCIEAIHAAEKAGYDVIVFDSSSHEWNGSGGCLEINDTTAHARMKGNTWAAWNETTPRHRAFVDAILQSPCHVVCTLRSKTETVQENGKVRKIGMKAEQREGTEFEFSVVLEIEHERHLAVATKDRTRLFPEPHKITTETGERLKNWLESGAEPVPEKSPLQRHAKAIEEAETLADLKTAFDKVNKDGSLTPFNKAELAKLKDARKAALTKPVVEDEGGPEPTDAELFPHGQNVGVMR